MKNALSPAFIEIDYHSEFGPHKMTVPTNFYNEADDTFEVWVGSPIDATTMIEALVDTFLPAFPTTTQFDSWRVFTQPLPEDLPQFRKAKEFTSKLGTASTPGWSKAVQWTVSMLGTDGDKARIVLLDAGSFGDFDRIATRGSSTVQDNIMSELEANTNGWRTRGESQIATFLQVSKTLNEKLRRAYRMF